MILISYEDKVKETITSLIQRKKDHLIIAGEVIYWIAILFISLFFIQIHGPLRVDDLYYEYAQYFKSLIFDNTISGNTPENIPEIVAQFRIFYPLLVAIISGLFHLNLFETGVLVSSFFGFGCILIFSKFVSLIFEEKKVERIFRMAFGSFGGFIIYWTKFSTDITFCFFVTASLYAVCKMWKEEINFKNFISYFICTIFAFSTRELGIFLIFPFILVLAQNRRLFIRIPLLFSLICGPLMILGSYFYFYSDDLQIWYSWFDYFYNEVWAFKSQPSSFHWENLLSFFLILAQFLFSTKAIITVSFSIIFTFGTSLIFLLIFFLTDKKVNLSLKKYFKKVKSDISPIFMFALPYTTIFYLLQASYMNERYLIPLTAIGVLLIGIYTEDNELKSDIGKRSRLNQTLINNCLIALIITNFLALFSRLLLLIFTQ